VTDRARVPFALVGVLLLVSSATLTATVGTQPPQRTPDVDRAMAGASAELATALRGAADDAATDAAAAPVTRPANTTAGRALNDSRPFRDALRLRVYLAARDRLGGVAVRRGDTVVTASLPPVDRTTAGYREAIERVHLERAGTDDAALRVTVDGVELQATREGRTVATDERAPSFVVATPALLLHDRTERFERRADAPVTESGLGRRLTARLYPVAWVRGHAQHRGAPIGNVLANRHVELATNDALLAEQRAAFGRADPGGHRAMAAAGRRVATTDTLVGVGGDGAWTDAVLGAADAVDRDPTGTRPPGAWRDDPPDATVTMDAATSADRAYADLLGTDSVPSPVGGSMLEGWDPADSLDGNGDGNGAAGAVEDVRDDWTDRSDGDDLSRLVERVHTVEARVAVDRRRLETSRRADGRPGASWQLVGERQTTRVDLDRVEGSPPAAEGWSTRETAAYDAVVTETTTRRWRRENETRTTEAVVERHLRLRPAVQARTVPVEGVPAGDLDGALSAATDRSVDRAVRDAGGLRGAARRAALGRSLPETRATADPVVDRERVEAAVGAVHREARTLSVTVPGPAVGAGRVNPPARLRAELADRRETLRGETGASARRRTFLAVRTAYLDALDDRLAARAATQAETNAGVESAVADRLDGLDGALASHRLATRPAPDRPADPAGTLTLAVDAAPAYLTTGAVRRERLAARGGGSVHPLAARNLNLFASPHGHVSASVVDRLPYVGTDRVSLATAAETLAAAETTGGVAPDRRRELEREVASANDHVRGELRTAMVAAGVSDRAARRALATDAGTADEARALANGSAVDRAVEAVDADVSDERLRVRLETTLEESLRDDRARPRREATTPLGEALRAAYRNELESTVEAGVERGVEAAKTRALGERMGSLPAGFPVAPVPGHWYATANVWYVEVGGTYERFAVRSDRGGPAGGTTYVRDGRSVHVSHGGDTLRLGSAERVSFRTATVVVVVVPPGGSGVGDTDGEPDERSAGWPPEPTPDSDGP